MDQQQYLYFIPVREGKHTRKVVALADLATYDRDILPAKEGHLETLFAEYGVEPQPMAKNPFLDATFHEDVTPDIQSFHYPCPAFEWALDVDARNEILIERLFIEHVDKSLLDAFEVYLREHTKDFKGWKLPYDTKPFFKYYRKIEKYFVEVARLEGRDELVSVMERRDKNWKKLIRPLVLVHSILWNQPAKVRASVDSATIDGLSIQKVYEQINRLEASERVPLKVLGTDFIAKSLENGRPLQHMFQSRILDLIHEAYKAYLPTRGTLHALMNELLIRFSLGGDQDITYFYDLFLKYHDMPTRESLFKGKPTNRIEAQKSHLDMYSREEVYFEHFFFLMMQFVFHRNRRSLLGEMMQQVFMAKSLLLKLPTYKNHFMAYKGAYGSITNPIPVASDFALTSYFKHLQFEGGQKLIINPVIEHDRKRTRRRPLNVTAVDVYPYGISDDLVSELLPYGDNFIVPPMDEKILRKLFFKALAKAQTYEEEEQKPIEKRKNIKNVRKDQGDPDSLLVKVGDEKRKQLMNTLKASCGSPIRLYFLPNCRHSSCIAPEGFVLKDWLVIYPSLEKTMVN